MSVDVENVCDHAGDEVVQLYIRNVVASVARPVKELRGFKRVALQPGEKKTIRFPSRRSNSTTAGCALSSSRASSESPPARAAWAASRTTSKWSGRRSRFDEIGPDWLSGEGYPISDYRQSRRYKSP